jgi:hypothetical protein
MTSRDLLKVLIDLLPDSALEQAELYLAALEADRAEEAEWTAIAGVALARWFEDEPDIYTEDYVREREAYVKRARG